MTLPPVAPVQMTLYSHAQRYLGVMERDGKGEDHPLIQWWLSRCGLGFDAGDETPWCSAMMNGLAEDLGLPRTRSAAARSWLTVGEVVPPEEALIGFDLVVLKRGGGPGSPPQPGPEVVKGAPGHVGVFGGWVRSLGREESVIILGGNQSNSVKYQEFPRGMILGVRRLRP